MPRRFEFTTSALAACALAVGLATSAGAFPDGPPDGFCGNPPNGFTCTLCHGDFEVNSGDGSLQLLGLPTAFQPGVWYDLTVQVADPGQHQWGFEMTALDPFQQQAGTFDVTDPIRTQLSDNVGTSPDYMKQTLAGSEAGFFDGPVSWSFRWLAPNADSADFYLAANAADESEDPSGDYIYALHVTISQTTVAVNNTTWAAMKSLYRSR